MARIRIALGNREFEIEGSESFIESHGSTVSELLGQFSAPVDSPTEASPRSSDDGVTPRSEGPLVGIEFGEALHLLPKNATGTDQILLAGKYSQTASDNQTFVTRDANRMLEDHGIKLTNASQALKNNLVAKRIFKVEGKYRLSLSGDEYLIGLVTASRGES